MSKAKNPRKNGHGVREQKFGRAKWRFVCEQLPSYRKQLTLLATMVALKIAHACSAKNGGGAELYQTKLAKELGVPQQNVSEAIQLLVKELGLFTATPLGKRGERLPTLYKMVLDGVAVHTPQEVYVKSKYTNKKAINKASVRPPSDGNSDAEKSHTPPGVYVNSQNSNEMASNEASAATNADGHVHTTKCTNTDNAHSSHYPRKSDVVEATSPALNKVWPCLRKIYIRGPFINDKDYVTTHKEVKLPQAKATLKKALAAGADPEDILAEAEAQIATARSLTSSTEPAGDGSLRFMPQLWKWLAEERWKDKPPKPRTGITSHNGHAKPKPFKLNPGDQHLLNKGVVVEDADGNLIWAHNGQPYGSGR